LEIYRKLLPSMILSGPSGVAVTGGAPAISDVVSYWPALMPQGCARPRVRVFSMEAGNLAMVSERSDLDWPISQGTPAITEPPLDPWCEGTLAAGRIVRLPLMAIAHARSGDKGDTSNIGLIGRSPECYVWLRDNITAALVKKWFTTLCHGEVERYLVPNLWALNFLLAEALGGGGTMSLFIDAQGKTLSQALLRCEMEIPEVLLATIQPQNKACVGELVKP
ncbi:MAG: hypothetical protein Q8O00_01540, partial [Holophaga sp.]|nr:hypothetical protein [Holophaga sp.]